MKLIVKESQYQKIIQEESKEKIFRVPGLEFFHEDHHIAFEILQKILEQRGNPPYIVEGDMLLEEAEFESLGNLIEVTGTLDLYASNIKTLGPLKRVGNGLNLGITKIESLGNLKYVMGYLNLYDSTLKSLGNLEYVGGTLSLDLSLVEDMGNLKIVGKDLEMDDSIMQSLGKLEMVGRTAYLSGSNVKDLGNLKEVGYDLILTNSKIESLGDLELVGGHLNLVRTPLQKMITLPELKAKVEIGVGIVGFVG